MNILELFSVAYQLKTKVVQRVGPGESALAVVAEARGCMLPESQALILQQQRFLRSNIWFKSWALTRQLQKQIHELENICLRRILDIHWTDKISNAFVCEKTKQPLMTDKIKSNRWCY